MKKEIFSAKILRLWSLLMVVGLFFSSVGGEALAAGRDPATLAVDPDGTDSGDCITSACATLGYALGQVIPGDMIVMAAGTYAENGLTISSEVTILGAQSDVDVEMRTPGDASETILDISGGDGIIIQEESVVINGLDIVGDADSNYAIYIKPGEDYDVFGVEILNNFIHGVSKPNTSTGSNLCYGVLGDGYPGTSHLYDILISGNAFFDLGGTAGEGPEVSSGYGVALYEVSDAVAGDGAMITGNSFTDLAEGVTDGGEPKNGAGVYVSLDGATTPLTGGSYGGPSSGVAVVDNMYENVGDGIIMVGVNSSIDEDGEDFTGVDMLVMNANGGATVNEAALGDYVKTNRYLPDADQTPYIGTVNHHAYFTTIEDAIDYSDDYATVSLTPGVYDEGISIDFPVTVVGDVANPGNVVIRGGVDLIGTRVGVWVNNVGVGPVVVKGLEIDGRGVDGVAGTLDDFAYGVRVLGSDDVTVEGNYVHDIKDDGEGGAGEGISFYNQSDTEDYFSDVTVKDNVVENTYSHGIRVASAEISSGMGYEWTINDGVTITGNELNNVYSSEPEDVSNRSIGGIYVAGGKDMEIKNNVIGGSGYGGIGVEGSDVGNVITGNSMTDVDKVGIYVDTTYNDVYSFIMGPEMPSISGNSVSVNSPARSGVTNLDANYRSAFLADQLGSQDTVFAADETAKGGATVSIVSAGDAAYSVWFAILGTLDFIANGATVTTAGGTATEINAPSEEGDYQMYVLNEGDVPSEASVSTLTVDNTAPTNQDSVFGADQMVNADFTGNVSINSSGEVTNEVWFAPEGETDFSVVDEERKKAADGTATEIAPPEVDGDYKLFVIDEAGNVSAPSTATLTVDMNEPWMIINSPDSNPTASSPVTIEVSFNEEVQGFTESDVTIGGVGGSVVGGSFDDSMNPVFSFDVAPSAEGEFTIDIAADAATDLAGNGSMSGSYSHSYDTTAVTFEMMYYADSGYTTLLADNYVGVGDYYLQIVASEALVSDPTLGISAEGSNNDVSGGVLVDQGDGMTFRYTRSVVTDPVAFGTGQEQVIINNVDPSVTDATPAGNAERGLYIDTNAPNHLGAMKIPSGVYKIGDVIEVDLGSGIGDDEQHTITSATINNVDVTSTAVNKGDGNYAVYYTVGEGDAGNTTGAPSNCSITVEDRAGNSTTITSVNVTGSGSNVVIDGDKPTAIFDDGVSPVLISSDTVAVDFFGSDVEKWGFFPSDSCPTVATAYVNDYTGSFAVSETRSDYICFYGADTAGNYVTLASGQLHVEADEPEVVRQVPISGDGDVPKGMHPMVVMTEEIDPASLTGNVELRDAGTDMPLAVTVSLGGDNNEKIIIEPDSDLEGGGSYYVFVGNGVSDLAGNGLVEDYGSVGETSFTVVNDANTTTYGVDGETSLEDGTSAVTIGGSERLDLGAGINTEDGGVIYVGGSEEDLSSYSIDGTPTDLTGTIDLGGGASMEVGSGVTLNSGSAGTPITLTSSDFPSVNVEITDGTTIFGEAGWEGLFEPPNFYNSTPSGTAPSGYDVGTNYFTLGQTGGNVLFDKPVTITLLGYTDEVAYMADGGTTWTVIDTTCGGTYASPSAPSFPGMCKITDGTDTKILTYHLTSFTGVTAQPSSGGTTTTSSGSSSSGGGGGSYNYTCNDGKDNDNDGKIDYPNDEDCKIKYSNDEKNIDDGKDKEEVEVTVEDEETGEEKLVRLEDVEGEVNFADVPAEAWFNGYVNVALEAGLIDGGEYFRPGDETNRAEFAKLLVEALGLEIIEATEAPFPDVKMGEWYTDYVNTLKVEGIVEGYPDGNFRPEASVSRAEAVKMIVEAKGLGGLPTDAVEGFWDVDGTQWYAKYVLIAKRLGYVGGYPDKSFKPGGKINRAEIVKIIVEMMS